MRNPENHEATSAVEPKYNNLRLVRTPHGLDVEIVRRRGLWVSSLGTKAHELPRPLRGAMAALARPGWSDTSDRRGGTAEIFEAAIRVWHLRGRYGLDHTEDVTLLRGLNTYYVRFTPDRVITGRALSDLDDEDH